MSEAGKVRRFGIIEYHDIGSGMGERPNGGFVLNADYEASERRVKELEQANNIAMQMRNWLTIFSTRKRGLTDNDIKIMGRLVDAFDAAISGQGEKQ